MAQAGIDFVKINPVVHYANVIQCRPEERYGPRMIYDYQFILVLEGRGVMKTPEGPKPALPGWLFYNRPAVKHDILPDPHFPFLLAGLHFSYWDDGGPPYPRGPYDPNRFQASRRWRLSNLRILPDSPVPWIAAGNLRCGKRCWKLCGSMSMAGDMAACGSAGF